MDDLFDLEMPSNAIKLGHDLRRACGAKLGLAIKRSDDGAKKEIGFGRGNGICMRKLLKRMNHYQIDVPGQMLLSHPCKYKTKLN